MPRVAFVSPAGELIRGASFEGKLDTPAFLTKLDAAKDGAAGGEGRFARTLRERGLLGALALVFAAGFLASLTPCVYPLIPITVSIFGARGAESRLDALGLSLTYVLGIAIMYSILGGGGGECGDKSLERRCSTRGSSGGSLRSSSCLGSRAWGSCRYVFREDCKESSMRWGGTGYIGALLIGLVAGIIAAPCVGPIVAGVLVYVAQAQDLFLGWLLLFVFALGLGVIFVVIGTFSGMASRLPSSGGWMDGVKALFCGDVLRDGALLPSRRGPFSRRERRVDVEMGRQGGGVRREWVPNMARCQDGFTLDVVSICDNFPLAALQRGTRLA